jgi:hypothetical protein
MSPLVPAGTFGAKGSQQIPAQYLDNIPSIVYSIPNLDGIATLKLTSLDSGKDVACVQAGVSNGRTTDVPAVSYVAVGIAGAALLLTGVSAIFGSASAVGGHAPSPSFGTILGWFQSMAMNGMMSVNYPPVYRSFAKNFAFSGGLIPWDCMQTGIDTFRQMTGGNLDGDNVQFLKNSTLAFTNGETNTTTFAKRAISFGDDTMLRMRDSITTNVNGSSSDSGPSTTTGVTHIVYGIQGYVEQLTIPQANTFMTALLYFSIVIAAIVVGILLFKLILEFWALFASFPKRLTGFRRRYWRVLTNAIVNLVLLLYGVWTLYCIFQFTNGDSWAAKLLAGVTLGIFTLILVFFAVKITLLARKYKQASGDASALYENKATWLKYSLFYDSYKKNYWWLFMPVIVYMFAKGCILAAANGHGLTQTVGQLILESLMFIILLWCRPYATSGGNWINITIQVVRVLSIVCILVFVESLGIAQTTKTITGVVLIVMQSVLTVVLAILIAVSAIITCCRENPHRKMRKEAELGKRDSEMLTPLDPHSSLLTSNGEIMEHEKEQSKVRRNPVRGLGDRRDYAPVPSAGEQPIGYWSSDTIGRKAVPCTKSRDSRRNQSGDIDNVPAGYFLDRQPTLPDIGNNAMGHRR